MTTCIANSDTTKGPEVPLWDCPCPDCTRMEWELNVDLDGLDYVGPLKAFRQDRFPEHYGRPAVAR